MFFNGYFKVLQKISETHEIIEFYSATACRNYYFNRMTLKYSKNDRQLFYQHNSYLTIAKSFKCMTTKILG